MYAPFRDRRIADMPKNGTSPPPALAGTGNSLVLIASDEELLAAARQMGLAVEKSAVAVYP